MSENLLLRRIDAAMDFSKIYEIVKGLYCMVSLGNRGLYGLNCSIESVAVLLNLEDV